MKDVNKSQEVFPGFRSELTFPELVFGLGASVFVCAVGYLGLQFLIRFF